ncbi:hypothetical protein EXS71_01745 [Candidatus Uhrbacteria bacterium]|nr:hypothetical protein [Candidatus Uhrbacteria bacterium]
MRHFRFMFMFMFVFVVSSVAWAQMKVDQVEAPPAQPVAPPPVRLVPVPDTPPRVMPPAVAAPKKCFGPVPCPVDVDVEAKVIVRVDDRKRPPGPRSSECPKDCLVRIAKLEGEVAATTQRLNGSELNATVRVEMERRIDDLKKEIAEIRKHFFLLVDIVCQPIESNPLAGIEERCAQAEKSKFGGIVGRLAELEKKSKDVYGRLALLEQGLKEVKDDLEKMKHIVGLPAPGQVSYTSPIHVELWIPLRLHLNDAPHFEVGFMVGFNVRLTRDETLELTLEGGVGLDPIDLKLIPQVGMGLRLNLARAKLPWLSITLAEVARLGFHPGFSSTEQHTIDHWALMTRLGVEFRISRHFWMGLSYAAGYEEELRRIAPGSQTFYKASGPAHLFQVTPFKVRF